MNFKKVARLCRIATEFPALAVICVDLIRKELPVVEQPERRFIQGDTRIHENIVANTKRLFEREGKLQAVKYWRNYASITLMDAKLAVERMARDNDWQKR